MPKYTVVENPPPFTQGQSTTSSIITTLNNNQSRFLNSSNRLIDTPYYNVIQRALVKAPTTIVNTTVLNQDIDIFNSGSIRTSAEYKNLSVMNSIQTRTQFINDGLDTRTYDDNNPPIWSTLINQLNSNILKEYIDIVLKFRVQTDTLGGTFEIEVFDGTVCYQTSRTINIEEQAFNVNFKLITNQNSITNGIKFFITPEMGMTLNVNNFSLLIIKEG